MSRPAPGTAARQDVFASTGVWERVAAEGGASVMARGPQLAEHLGGLLRYQLVADGTVLAALPGQPPQSLDVDLLDMAWRLTADGMSGQSSPTRADLAEAAELLRTRAGAEGRRRHEEAAVAAAARESGERVDVEAHAAAAAARRAALQRELAELDEAPSIEQRPAEADTERRPWWRGATHSAP